ncbi:MAG: putative rane protein [Pseudomonadota bacterium]|jgi:putative Mn2+ efflux pump MntP
MSFWQILLLAVGLAMDATAVAAARGCASGVDLFAQDVLRVALLFGFAQAIMPVFGWVLGQQLGPSVAAFDHWIAFVLLVGIGAKMLHEARAEPELESQPAGFGFRLLLGLAVATSIDAFAVGITLPMLKAPFVLSIVTIGVVTALLSGLGVVVGRQAGKLLGSKLDALGGAVLILLGVKILVEHLSGNG